MASEVELPETNQRELIAIGRCGIGYSIHITRQDHWYEKDEAKSITEAEWRAVVDADPQMRLCSAAEVSLPAGGLLRYVNPPLLAEWLDHPEQKKVWFDFSRGRISVNNADEPALAQMRQLAQKLRGRVQGDDGEFYDFK